MSAGWLSRHSRFGRLLREGSWVGGGQVLNIAARLVGLRLLTELAPPAVYGEVVLLVGVLTLVRDVCCTPVLTTTLRYYPDAAAAGRVGALRRLVGRMLRRTTGLAALLLPLGGGVWLAFSDASAGPGSLLLLVALLGLDVQRLFETNLLNAARRQAAFSLWRSADAWARALAAVGALLWIGPSAVAILLGYALGAALVNGLFQALVVRSPGPDRDGDAEWAGSVRHGIMRYALPLAPLAILGWVTNLGDRYVLAELVSASEVGIYAAAFGLASQPFLLVSETVGLTLRPLLFDAHARGDAGRMARALWTWLGLLLLAFVPGVWLIDLLAGPIVRLLLGEPFWAAAPLLVWLGAAYAVQGVQQAFASLIYAEGRTRLLILVHVATAASAVAFYLLLIPRFGALGAALAALGSKSVACAATFIAARAWVHLAPTRLRGGGSGQG